MPISQVTTNMREVDHLGTAIGYSYVVAIDMPAACSFYLTWVELTVFVLALFSKA
jgi:hypothetical protein